MVKINDGLEMGRYLAFVDDLSDSSFPPIALSVKRVVAGCEFKPIKSGSCYPDAGKDFATDWKNNHPPAWLATQVDNRVLQRPDPMHEREGLGGASRYRLENLAIEAFGAALHSIIMAPFMAIVSTQYKEY